ncbi:MAG: hypothetical protein J0I06_11335, partial [Planctomycetes bacterium]|nr:hypothetical protein [Planctomycetota bacterium]
WIEAHPNSFPPMVINLTDAEGNDCDLWGAAAGVRSLATAHGNVLLMTIHVSSSATGKCVMFPDRLEQMLSKIARVLFEVSSELPGSLQQAAAAWGIDVRPGCRMMASDADAVGLLRAFDFLLKLLRPRPPHPPLAAHLR